jgi:hypothetical protein
MQFVACLNALQEAPEMAMYEAVRVKPKHSGDPRMLEMPKT